MKIKNILYICLFFGLIAFSFQSCGSDDDTASQQLEVVPIEYSCFDPDELIRVFTVVEQMPSFGSSESDILNYLLPLVDITSIDEIEDGAVILKIVIRKTGRPCLSLVYGRDVPQESLLGFQDPINNMPDWEPGTQREIPEDVYYNLPIKIIDGEVVQ